MRTHLPYLSEAASLLLLAAILAGCAPRRGETGTVVTVDRGRLGIDDVVADALRRSHSPGAVVAVVVGDTVAWLKAYGVARAGATEPMDLNARFQAPAALPLINALAASSLAGLDRFDLDAPIGAYVPDLPRELHSATIAQLLSHTAGLVTIPAMAGRTGEDDLFTQVHHLSRHDRFTAPGAIYSWSPPGIALAAYIMQRVVQRPYGEVVAEAVLAPLGMNRSSVGWPGDSAVTPDHAAPELQPPGGPPTVEPRPVAPESALAVPLRAFYTTAPEMTSLMRAVLNDGVVAGHRRLREGVVDRALRPRGITPDSETVALGPVIRSWEGRPLIALETWAHGHPTILHLLPDDGIGVLVMTNHRMGVGFEDLPDFVFRRFLGLPDRGWPYPEEPPAGLFREPGPRHAGPLDPAAIVGEYCNGGECLQLLPDGHGGLRLRSGDLVLDVTWREGRYNALIPDGRTALEFDLVTGGDGRLYLWLPGPRPPHYRGAGRALARDAA